MTAINVQELAANAYNIITNIQQTAAELVGLDALWCRATPVINSEDIVLAEYTLTEIGLECPKMIKVLTSNTDYNPGNFNVDLFGISYDAPLELHITIETWHSVFGKDTMPQQGDVVYVKILHKLYEVKSSEVMYTIASMPTYFKVQCAKYNPTASRRETEEFRLSIDELTTSEAVLFGEEISQEVADVVVENETSYQNTTYVDPMKDCDLDSIANEALIGPGNVTISNGFYDLYNAEKPITYKVSANYIIDTDRPHWIYTSWFRYEADPTSNEHTLKVLKLITKDNKYWYFKISCATTRFDEGDTITLMRGSLIKVDGDMIKFPVECEGHHSDDLLLRIKASEMNRTNRKMTDWWKSGNYKIKKDTVLNLISTDTDKFRVDVNISSASYTVRFGNTTKTFTPKRKIDLQQWTYICIDFTSTGMRTILSTLEDSHLTTKDIRIIDKHDSEYKFTPNSGEFDFNEMKVDSMGKHLNICNIRLYENEYPVEETYKQDMLSIITRNASRIILVDSPNMPNEAKFITPVR